MGTTADKLQAILDSKAAIKTAINSVNNALTDSTPLDEYAGQIDDNIASIFNKTMISIDKTDITFLQNYQFFQHTQLISVNLPNVTTLGTSGYEFSGCTSLQSIVLGSITTPNNFATVNFCTDCSSLTSITFGDYYGQLGANSFKNCSSLQSINLKRITAINGAAFSGCTSLQSITIENTGNCTLSNVNAIPTGQNITIYVPSSKVSWYQAASNWTTLYQNGDVTFSAIV